MKKIYLISTTLLGLLLILGAGCINNNQPAATNTERAANITPAVTEPGQQIDKKLGINFKLPGGWAQTKSSNGSVIPMSFTGSKINFDYSYYSVGGSYELKDILPMAQNDVKKQLDSDYKFVNQQDTAVAGNPAIVWQATGTMNGTATTYIQYLVMVNNKNTPAPSQPGEIMASSKAFTFNFSGSAAAMTAAQTTIAQIISSVKFTQ